MSRLPLNPLIWGVLGAFALAVEAIALLNKKPGDTLTDVVRKLLKRGYSVALVPAYVWLGWHWFLERGILGTVVWDDLLLIGAAVAAVLAGSRKKSAK